MDPPPQEAATRGPQAGVFLYPWAVAFDQLGLFGLVEMVLFIGTVFVAYAYVWRRGGLEWD